MSEVFRSGWLCFEEKAEDHTDTTGIPQSHRGRFNALLEELNGLKNYAEI